MTSSERGGPAARIVTRGDGATIAYHRTPGASPGVVFLAGFRSDMTGAKALALEAACRARGRAYLRFDYTGHGQSSGDFAEGTIGDWAADAIFAIERLTEGPQVLVGSSMGGWIMLLAALALGPRVAGPRRHRRRARLHRGSDLAARRRGGARHAEARRRAGGAVGL